MLIVAMLAQTTTAVPAQRLLFPQHWLLAGWDMVGAARGSMLLVAARALRSTKRGCPLSNTFDWAAGTLHHSTRSEHVPQKLATPRICLSLVSYTPLALARPACLESQHTATHFKL